MARCHLSDLHLAVFLLYCGRTWTSQQCMWPIPTWTCWLPCPFCTQDSSQTALASLQSGPRTVSSVRTSHVLGSAILLLRSTSNETLEDRSLACVLPLCSVFFMKPKQHASACSQLCSHDCSSLYASQLFNRYHTAVFKMPGTFAPANTLLQSKDISCVSEHCYYVDLNKGFLEL